MMRLIFSTLLPCFSIGIVLFLLFAAVRFIFREKYRERYAEALLKLPETNRERFLKSENSILILLKLGWWLSIPVVILMPLATLMYRAESLRGYFLPAAVGMMLFSFMILQEYLFRKSLIDYLRARAIIK
jgi:hypothetical protein